MTPPPLRPPVITQSDEIKSLQFYLSLAFPHDEIRRSRPQEDEPYDMLIDTSIGVTSEHRGPYLSETTMMIVVQRWCQSHDQAMQYSEAISQLMMKGIAPGHPRRVPIWQWNFVRPKVQPDISTDDPSRYLRVVNCETRILQADPPTKYVAICEVEFKGWRITHEFTDQLIEEVDIEREQL